MPANRSFGAADVEPHAGGRGLTAAPTQPAPEYGQGLVAGHEPRDEQHGRGARATRGTAELPVDHQPGQLKAVPKLAAKRYIRGLTQRKQVGHRSKPTRGEDRPPALWREPLARLVGSQR